MTTADRPALRKTQYHSTAWLLLGLLLAGRVCAGAPPVLVSKWERFERAFQSVVAYANPLQDALDNLDRNPDNLPARDAARKSPLANQKPLKDW